MQTLVLFLAAVFAALYLWSGLVVLGRIAADWWRQPTAGPYALAMSVRSPTGGGAPRGRKPHGVGLPSGGGLPADLVNGFADNLTAELAPVTKRWWQSRSIWGSIIAILSVVGGWIGIEIDGATQAYLIDQTIVAVTAAGVLIGAVLGIIGRLRATRTIR